MKRALVTGGSGAIGAAICKALAASGLQVTVHANTRLAEAQRIAAAIREGGQGRTQEQQGQSGPDSPGSEHQRGRPSSIHDVSSNRTDAHSARGVLLAGTHGPGPAFPREHRAEPRFLRRRDRIVTPFPGPGGRARLSGRALP